MRFIDMQKRLAEHIEQERDKFQEQLDRDEALNGKVIDRIRNIKPKKYPVKCDWCWKEADKNNQISFSLYNHNNPDRLDRICDRCVMFMIMQHHKLKYFREHTYIKEKNDKHETKHITIYRIGD